tara:strand:+ start:18340 stop:19266 length:927 start_codon:yes stop_codon:yes gene_type:complete
MNNINALVVGVGNMGQFHCESLADHGFSVFCVDPIFKEIKNVCWSKDIKSLERDKFDVIIISTTAKLHYPVIEELRNNRIFSKNIIIEKPLFCNRSDYDNFKKISENEDVEYYVNLPFYYQSQINQIINEFNLGMLEKYKCNGTNWGLACNILHDVSIIDRISNIDGSDIRGIVFHQTLIEESKREGYLEVYGQLKMKIKDIDIEIESKKGSNFSKLIELEFTAGKIEISFNNENIKIFKSGKTHQRSFDIPRASKLTGQISKQIINTPENQPIPLVDKYSLISLDLYSCISKNNTNKFKIDFDFPYS